MTALVLPLLAVPLFAWKGRAWGPRGGWVALAFAAASAACLVGLWMGAEPRAPLVITWPWIPSLGVSLGFLVDGLSLFFGLLVTGIGVLVMLYASQYLDAHAKDHGRFYATLMLFMAAMLGTVFSDNLLTLFVFWEVTGLASFLLIGFEHEDPQARRGARMSLLVTCFTGLALFLGILLLGLQAGTFSFSQLLAEGARSQTAPSIVAAALVLVLIGAFGKSAQFPFHFWLPNAMAAPTPVSAYLHSATMVNLGIFLVARLYPLFGSFDLWWQMLAPICFLTMLLGAVLALLSNELKAILAFSTVSQLGLLMGFYALGDGRGVHYDYLHILNHSIYKGCLFMVAGIVIHTTHLKDIRQLGGLWKVMPLTAVACAVGAAAMAGVPGTLGFISKELLLADLLKAGGWHGPAGWVIAAAVVLASTLKVAFSLRLLLHLFFRPAPAGLPSDLHRPGFLLQLAPLVLAAATLVLGFFPGALQHVLVGLAVEGTHDRGFDDLHLWHGFNLKLALSVAIFAAGGLLYLVAQKLRWQFALVPRWLRFDLGFDVMLEGLFRGCRALTRISGVDRPVVHLPVMTSAFLIVVGGTVLLFLPGWWPAVAGSLTAEPAAAPPLLRWFTAAVIAAATVGVVAVRGWTVQLVGLMVIGFLVAFYFVLYRAPDLAMTQILVETATLLILLVLLARFPRTAQQDADAHQGVRRRVGQVVLSVAAGVLATVLVLIVTTRPSPNPAGLSYLEKSVPLAKGTNAVNTILVDFRGLDTLGEIAVLVIAALGVLGLLMRYRRRGATPEASRGLPGFTDAVWGGKEGP